MGNELILMIVLEIVSIAFFAGIYVATVKHNRELITRIESSFHANISRIENSFKEKFGQLEKKQDKHNSIIERTYCIERDLSVVQEQNKVQNHRIDDLERKYENVG